MLKLKSVSNPKNQIFNQQLSLLQAPIQPCRYVKSVEKAAHLDP